MGLKINETVIKPKLSSEIEKKEYSIRYPVDELFPILVPKDALERIAIACQVPEILKMPELKKGSRKMTSHIKAVSESLVPLWNTIFDMEALKSGGIKLTFEEPKEEETEETETPSPEKEKKARK